MKVVFLSFTGQGTKKEQGDKSCFVAHFSSNVGVCRSLKSIVVQIGIEDYFEDPNSPEARKLFDEMVNKLQVRNTSIVPLDFSLDTNVVSFYTSVGLLIM